jgi:hypothetical protein
MNGPFSPTLHQPTAYAKENENQGDENYVKKNLARCGKISIVSGFGSREGASFFRL